MRPRGGRDIPVCGNCQGWIDEDQVTISGAKGDAGAAWKISDEWVEYDITGQNEPSGSPPAEFDSLGIANSGEGEGLAQAIADALDDE